MRQKKHFRAKFPLITTTIFILVLLLVIFAEGSNLLSIKTFNGNTEYLTIYDQDFYDNEQSTGSNDITAVPKRYIVFLPDRKTDYPWQDQILYRYKLFPAILVSSFPGKLFKWLDSVDGAKVYPDASYQRSLASTSKLVELTSIAAFDTKIAVNAQPLLSSGINGSGIRIGIIDTGINEDPVELADKVVAEQSFVNTTFGYSQDVISTVDYHGHGTKVASVAAGKIIGMAPGAELVNAKIFEVRVAGNAGEILEETTSAVIAAIEYCVEQGCDVINLSIGQYHNLVNDARGEAIDHFSKNYGVVFSVAAGNEGWQPYCSGTLGNPGSAFQAITVASYNSESGIMASSSGSGPRPDYTMKPDISAPGVNVKFSSTSSSGFSGTSAAAPVVAGAAALLIHHLGKNGLNYSSGTIKAALLDGAVTLSPGGIPLPPDYQGAGFLNVSDAWNCLKAASITDTEVDLLTSLPDKLPFRPFTTLFTGESIAFNETIISSRNVTATLSLEGLPAEFISFPGTIDLKDSTRLPVNFTIPDSAQTGVYNGNIIVSYGTVANVSIKLEFEVREPSKRVLFDEKHTVITYRPNSVTDSWGDTNFLSGMFREYAKALIDQNISITPFREGQLTTNLLGKYDALILANPCSWVTDKYTDWIDTELLDYDYAAYSLQEYGAIETFVKENGGGLLVFTLGYETINVEALNGLLNRFGLNISSGGSNYGLVTDLYGDLPFLASINSYYHYGTTSIEVIDGSGAFGIANISDNIVAAGNSYDYTGGRILTFTTEYPFNNIGMNELYIYGTTNKLLAVKTTEWVCENETLNEHSLSSPVISFPNGGETLTGTVTIQWAAINDTLGHHITYSVHYSPDAGKTWTELVSGLEITSYPWNTSEVMDSSEFIVRVIATCSEGLSTDDFSDGLFTIKNGVTGTSTPPSSSLTPSSSVSSTSLNTSTTTKATSWSLTAIILSTIAVIVYRRKQEK